ncbi:MFS transporter [Streptomyces decoyicus]|uniref:MFS transporter n=1 Tax=Streptomyces decoyicus TaxID=249567 RepID=UPI00345CC81A
MRTRSTRPAARLIGIFVGGPLFGRLADHFGRRPVFLVDMLIFLIGSVLHSSSLTVSSSSSPTVSSSSSSGC